MRSLFAIVLVAHGIAHLVGFVMPWGLMPSTDAADHTSVLNGALDLGEAGAKVFGILWLALAVGFVVSGGAMLAGLGNDGWIVWIVRLAGLSFVFCALAWPEARIGVAVNLAILTVLFVWRELVTI